MGNPLSDGAIRKNFLNKLQKALATKEKIAIFLYLKSSSGPGGPAAASQLGFEKPLCLPSPPSGCPRGRPALPRGLRRRSPRGDGGRLLAKPASAKMEMKPKKGAGRDKSSDKKVQAKRKSKAKGKQKWLTKKLKMIYSSPYP